MHIRKIAVVGGFAVGAALSFAPLASADPLSGVVDTEIASQNSTFEFYAALAGDSADVTKATVPGTYDTILPKDVPYFAVGDTTDVSKVTPLEYELYGVNPIQAGISNLTPGTATGFEELNGAVTKFDDAYNVFLYAAEDKGALIPVADVFGNHSEFVTAAGATDASAFADYYNFAIGDLGGFFGTNLNFLDITPAASTELFTFLGSL